MYGLPTFYQGAEIWGRRSFTTTLDLVKDATHDKSGPRTAYEQPLVQVALSACVAS